MLKQEKNHSTPRFSKVQYNMLHDPVHNPSVLATVATSFNTTLHAKPTNDISVTYLINASLGCGKFDKCDGVF